MKENDILAHPIWDENSVKAPGMTLRDKFAGDVLPMIYQTAPEWSDFDDIAERSYRMADAMLKARKGDLCD